MDHEIATFRVSILHPLAEMTRHRALLIAGGLCLAACGFAHVNSDEEARPDRVIGVGATVIYPGQQAPGVVGPGAPPASSPGGGGSQPGGPDSTGSMTMVGGTSAEVSGSERIRRTPLGPITTLFGYPFWIFGKSLHEKAEKEQASMSAPGGSGVSSGSQPALSPDQLEQERLSRENARLEEELERASRGAAPRDPEGSISKELDELRQTVARRSPPSGATPPVASAPGRLREAQDRDLDGRPDRWVSSGPRDQTREALDEDGDGRAEQVHVYSADGSLLRSEEDLDGDGTYETVTLYSGGHVTHKRADTNQDGLADTWSFYREGELVRHEVDRDGDGFRDLSLYYEGEALVREEEDANGDGRPDLVTEYAAGERSRREEDLDHDGTPDVISFYEGGKLVRKEVRSEDLLRSGEAEQPPPEGS
jgi:hypothetical protein